MNRRQARLFALPLALLSLWASGASGISQNLTCYQCVKNTDEQCGEETLLPCPPISDRCVTHITKDPKKGFSIKRECGLGPCAFDDAMMNRGLGLDVCDRTKDDYFCLFCCRESGCNKNSAAPRLHTSLPALFLCVLSVTALLYR